MMILSRIAYLLIVLVVGTNAFSAGTTTSIYKNNNKYFIKIINRRHSFFISSKYENNNSDDDDSFERFRSYISQLKSSREFRKSSLDYLITGLGELKQSVVDSFHFDSSSSRGGRYLAFEVLFSILTMFGFPIVLQILLHSFAITLQIVGAVLSVVSIWILRKNFSLFEAPRNNMNSLVREGPYKYIRHPFYAGILMYLLGAVVKSRDMYRLLGWFGLAVILVSIF